MRSESTGREAETVKDSLVSGPNHQAYGPGPRSLSLTGHIDPSVSLQPLGLQSQWVFLNAIATLLLISQETFNSVGHLLPALFWIILWKSLKTLFVDLNSGASPAGSWLH